MAVNGYFIPTVNLIGEGSVNEVGNKVVGLGGKKVLLVTDAMLVKLGMAAKIEGILKEAGLEVVLFGGAEPNPTDKNVLAGMKVWKKEKCDSIVSLGGGSSHDCAKGIGLVASNGGKIQDFEGVDKSQNEMVPLVSVNTTAGTASEMTRFCIITDSKRKVKMAIVDWRVTPSVSINDPGLMMGMPPALTAATGMDALTHSVEAYVSTAANPLTDSAALMSIKLIAEYLPMAVANGTNMLAREKMAYAQLLAGMAFNNASLGYVHAMAHQLGGFYNLPHGVCNAILLPVVSEFNIIGNTERFKDIAEAMGENIDGLSTVEAARKAISAIKALSSSVGIPSGLSELGVKEEDFEVMATNAKLDACQLTNPRLASLEQVIELFRQAM
ncbi:alcohol dehydrogenase [Dethiosulfatibacter aminovorans DSM 17477]|uniref:Alcohol dehydrogenase n=1 Tax=Dethiosulfatibacter aminovorans DSM 17477 TaxID=1121476 RepID=A0A1M6GCP4_9FIRM|nr:iron-containing alcohol dehydrogenase [Dethiosulfatibacter aminovorans]SHJ07694.1 alcohol dehydrogenase [Dethiosulfatibacter aminovorans DSM 17477]